MITDEKVMEHLNDVLEIPATFTAFNIDYRNIWTPLSDQGLSYGEVFVLVKRGIKVNDKEVINPVTVEIDKVFDFKGNEVKEHHDKDRYVFGFTNYKAAFDYIETNHPEGNVFPMVFGLNEVYQELPYTMEDRCVLEYKPNGLIKGYLINSYIINCAINRFGIKSDILHNHVTFEIESTIKKGHEYGVLHPINQDYPSKYREYLLKLSFDPPMDNHEQLEIKRKELQKAIQQVKTPSCTYGVHLIKEEGNDREYVVLVYDIPIYWTMSETSVILDYVLSDSEFHQAIKEIPIHFRPKDIIEMVRDPNSMHQIREIGTKWISQGNISGSTKNSDDLQELWKLVKFEDVILYARDYIFKNNLPFVYNPYNVESIDDVDFLDSTIQSCLFNLFEDNDNICKSKASDTSVFDIGTTRIQPVVSHPKEVTVLMLPKAGVHVKGFTPLYLNYLPAIQDKMALKFNTECISNFRINQIMFEGKMSKEQVVEIMYKMMDQGIVKQSLGKLITRNKFLLSHAIVAKDPKYFTAKWQLTDFPEVFIR